MRFKHIAFDMDGTLIDSIPSIMQSFQEAVKTVYGHYEKDENILKHSIGLPLSESFKCYRAEDKDALEKAYISANDRLQKNGVPFFDGVLELLKDLKNKGYKLHIVTSKRKNSTLHWMDVMKVNDLFDVVVCREDTALHKPNGEPIERCISLVGCEREEMLYVGDSVHDIGCAHNAGVKVAVVGWTNMDKEELFSKNPDYVIETPKDLLDIV